MSYWTTETLVKERSVDENQKIGQRRRQLLRDDRDMGAVAVLDANAFSSNTFTEVVVETKRPEVAPANPVHQDIQRFQPAAPQNIGKFASEIVKEKLAETVKTIEIEPEIEKPEVQTIKQPERSQEFDNLLELTRKLKKESYEAEVKEDYAELDRAASVVEANEISISFRGKVVMVCVAVTILALMIFMIINAVAIAGLNADIAAINADLIANETAYNILRNTVLSDSSLMTEAARNGFVEIPPENIFYYTPASQVASTPGAETNWFNDFVIFWQNLFR